MKAAEPPAQRRSPVVRLAPAKLNLTLAVAATRADGYHELHSVFVPLTLADRLSFALTADQHDRLHVTGFDPGPAADNIVPRAIAATRAAVGGEWPGGPGPTPGLAVRLDKRIPVAAGLAGGSSDAAAAIDGALEAWGTSLDADTRLSVAARLGSDVPFFAIAGPALIEGRGERVTALTGLRGQPGILLVTPAIAVSTREVFAAFDALRGVGDGAVRLSSAHLAAELRKGLSSADLVARAGVLTVANDLLPATVAVLPELVPFKRALTRQLARPVGLSGSGPTLWALYASEAEAATAAAGLRAALDEGTLVAPGGGAPFIGATSIVSHASLEEPRP